jgi:hypothetical protein
LKEYFPSLKKEQDPQGLAKVQFQLFMDVIADTIKHCIQIKIPTFFVRAPSPLLLPKFKLKT